LPDQKGEKIVTDTKFLEVSNFMLQKGGFLPSVRLAYRTIGALNAAKDNAILIPSWYTGTDADSEMFLCGPNRALNPEKYFIVLTNLLGNGISSSPSNTPAPFDRGRFPKITLHDNVRLQHQLVTEELGLKSLRLVTGWSMGACQTYQWAAQYQDMVRAAGPIAGSARTASFNKVFLLSLRRALELDPSFEDGFYERPPIRGLRAFASIYAGWGVSEAFYRTGAYSAFAANDHEQFVQYFWEPFFQRCDANNLLSQLWTWEQGNISDNPLYKGDFEAALKAIKARTIILPVDTDRYFPPVDAEYEAQHIPNSACRVVKSAWGHMAPINAGDISGFDTALAELLDG
jgi:homoserine O-acetyltransferase/O-succinyltransferase